MTNQKNHQMKQSTSSLIDALNKFQDSNTKAERDGTNPYFKSDYATLDEVIRCCNYGAKFGLAFSQQIDFEKDIVEGQLVTTQFVRTTLYHTSSQQAITSRHIIAVKGNKFDDSHAVGSAITYAKRYSLLAIYGLATQDDDGNANSEVTDNKSTKSKVDSAAKTKAESDKVWIQYQNNYISSIVGIINNENKDYEDKKKELNDYVEIEAPKKSKLAKELPGLHEQLDQRIEREKKRFKEMEVKDGKSNGN